MRLILFKPRPDGADLTDEYICIRSYGFLVDHFPREKVEGAWAEGSNDLGCHCARCNVVFHGHIRLPFCDGDDPESWTGDDPTPPGPVSLRLLTLNPITLIVLLSPTATSGVLV